MENQSSNPYPHVDPEMQRRDRERKEAEERKILSKKFPNDKIAINGLIGIGLILLSIYLETIGYEKGWFRTLCHLIRDTGIAFLSAAMISYLIEIPSLLDYFKEMIINALKDKHYLEGLSDSELETIKETCNNLLFLYHGKREDVYLNESLIEFENEIFRLLMKPYYEYFITTIECTDYVPDIAQDFLGGTCIKKIVQTNFKIVNPLKGQKTEKLLPPFRFYCPEEFSCEDMVKITKFRVRVDGAEYKDFADDIVLHFESDNSKYPNYNQKLTYKLNKEQVKFTFLNEITVEMEEIRLISSNDKIYSKRMDKPTKNLTINYLYDNPKFKLKADCFSTLPSLYVDNLILTEHSNSIFIESKTWLLPGNGILIAIVPKEELPQPSTVEKGGGK